MRISTLGCVVAALAISLATGGHARAQAGKAAQPPELLATVGIGPDNTLDTLRAFANTMQPGAGMMLSSMMLRRQLAGMVTATTLDGLDDKASMYVLAVDGGPALKGVALVGKLTDEKKLTAGLGAATLVKKNGWAVVGPKAIAEKVAPYAFTALAPQPTISGPPIATIYTTNLVVRYKTELAAFRAQMAASMGAANAGQMAGVMQTYLDGMFSTLDDTDRVIISFEITKDLAAIDLALAPKPGSRLAKFIALQKASDFGLVAKLPAIAATAIVAGHLDSGPYRNGMLDAMAQMYGPSMPKDMVALIGSIMKASTGDFVMAMQLSQTQGMEMTQLFGLSDTKTVDKAIGQLLDGLKTPRTMMMGNIGITMSANTKPITHDGVVLRGYDGTYDMSKADPTAKAMMARMSPTGGTSARIGTFDQLGVVATSGLANANATSAVDAARGKGKRLVPAQQITDYLAGARTRKESIAMVLDLGAFTGSGAGRNFMMSFGFADKNAHVRIAVPSATVRALTGQP